jgi:hypothetical protein
MISQRRETIDSLNQTHRTEGEEKDCLCSSVQVTNEVGERHQILEYIRSVGTLGRIRSTIRTPHWHFSARGCASAPIQPLTWRSETSRTIRSQTEVLPRYRAGDRSVWPVSSNPYERGKSYHKDRRNTFETGIIIRLHHGRLSKHSQMTQINGWMSLIKAYDKNDVHGAFISIDIRSLTTFECETIDWVELSFQKI